MAFLLVYCSKLREEAIDTGKAMLGFDAAETHEGRCADNRRVFDLLSLSRAANKHI